MYGILWHLNRYNTETLIMIVSAIGFYFWFESFMASILGIFVGRILYVPIRLICTRLMLGFGWSTSLEEMKWLQQNKRTINNDERLAFTSTANGRYFGYCLGLVAVVIGFIWKVSWLIWFGFIISAIIFPLSVYLNLPAFVLYLGTSSKDSLHLMRKVKNEIYPHRIVSLLDIETLRKSKGFRFESTLQITDCVRVERTVDWFEAVTRLAKVTPIIILDVRSSSDAVSREIELLQEDTNALKTFIILDVESIDAGGNLLPPGSIGISPWVGCKQEKLLSILAEICRNPGKIKNLNEFC